MNDDLPTEAASEHVLDAPGDVPADLSGERPKTRTLPPPEWLGQEGPRSAGSLALERYDLDSPVPDRIRVRVGVGPRAELASLGARLAAANIAGDAGREGVAAASLSRALSVRGTELELATRYARRSLLLNEDPVLREELAGWFASLGEPSLAASTLRPLLVGKKGLDASSLNMRLAVLLGRAGDAEGQRDALTLAARENPAEPQALELLGAIGAWAPHVVSGQAAAQAYLEAAERRERLGERSSAFEDLLRAYEMAPESAAAADRLAQILTLRSRSGAADEVYREHARALGAAAGPVHLKRLRAAVADGDFARALGAAFDARLDAQVDLKSVLSAVGAKDGALPASEIGFDELLERAGLHELFAARLELARELLAGRERARVGLTLGRLYNGPLGRLDRALDSWIDALVADPGNADAKSLLRAHASSTRDHGPLVEALIRIGEGSAGSERSASLRELATLAEERLSDPGLALWAIERVLETEPDDGLVQARERLAPRVQAQVDALRVAEAELERESGPQRVEVLARVSSLLQGRPERADRWYGVLRELCQLVPAERSHQTALERLLVRGGKLAELDTELERLSERAGSANERARVALLRSSVRRRRGDWEGALAELAPFVDEPGSHIPAWSLALLIASQRGAFALHARALLRVAAQLAPAFRATLSSVAAEALLNLGDMAAARAAADQACYAEPSLARPVAARARIGLVTADRWGAEAMERAMGVIVPRAELCRALAHTYEALGEPLLSMAFTQRLIALRPGDLDAARARLERVTRAGDGSRLADALAWLLSQPEPLAGLSELLDTALRALAQLDPARAGELARRALDVLGPRLPLLRSAVLAVADTTGERGLAIAAIERFLAAGAAGDERIELLLDLARRRRAAADPDGSARALLRAVREGAKPAAVLAELESAPPTKSSDGELATLEARAEALSGSAQADQADTALAWREVGAAYFDLAADLPRAVKAWERAAALNPERGIACFAGDLLAFAGPDEALAALVDLAARRAKPSEAARVLATASAVALSAGKTELAFEVASRALDLDPSGTDVLAVAERSASEQQLPALEALYQRLSEAALGAYGERAVHYRAARQLEKRNVIDRALWHAIRAFEAVPSEGVAFMNMARLADRCEQNADVVQAIERVALKEPALEVRAAWLRRAALLAAPSAEGKQQRVEVLLRALALRPEVELVRALSDALRELLTSALDDREGLELRFERAITRLLPKLSGPQGARIALACASAALETFGSARVAVRAIARAAECDAQLEEFQGLLDAVPQLREAEADAAELVRAVQGLSEQKFGGAGAALLELGARLAAALAAPAEPSVGPNDLAALAAAEQSAEERNDYETLLGLLERRASLVESVDDVRRIRLRRASVLEQRLGRADEARTELESLIAATGDSLSVLRVLADLHDRLSAPLRAAPIWLRASAVARDRTEAADLSRRACESYLHGSDVDSARRVLEGMGAWAQSPKLLELVVEVERRRGTPQTLAEALDELATASNAPEQQRADWLVEGARAWLSGGHTALALSLATRAARIAPESASAQLLARQLEYQGHGPGDPGDARGTIAELRGIRTTLDPQQVELCAFLIAEALDVTNGSGAGEAELTRVSVDLGERPLLALGLAERKAEREPAEALRLFDVALGGDLYGLRARGKVALRAAEVAFTLDHPERARGYLAIAMSETGTRDQARLEIARHRPERAQASTLVSSAFSDVSARTERGLGSPPPAPRTLLSSGSLRAAAFAAAEVTAEEASTSAVGRGRYSQVPAAPNPSLDRDSSTPAPRLAATAASLGHDVPKPPSPATARAAISGRYSVAPPVEPLAEPPVPRDRSIRPSPVHSVRPATVVGPQPLPYRPPDTLRQNGHFPAASAGESVLLQRLQDGSIEAGVELVKELENRTSRTQDLVMVCRRVALLAPGDAWAVGKLHEAALADRNLTYARAIEHVLALLIPGRPRIEPPSLAEQVEQPDAVRAMLFRDSMGPVQEALAIVWEGAEHVFRRDASTYGVTGMERVPLSSSAPLGRVYAGAARALALTRTPLFQRRSAGAITVNLALLSPPAVILSGDVRQDTPELRFHLGAMLAASIPQYALLFGSPESQARAVLKGLGFAFGPPRQTKSGGVLNLAEVLWESIPARFQRRLRELCDRPEQLDYDAALAASRVAVRRAGLFVAGDLGVALNEAAGDDGVTREQLRAPNALAELSRSAPSLRSLLTLALSPEYAETRWQFGANHRTTRF